MARKITLKGVKAAIKTPHDQYLWDDEIKGFGLKVTPKGRKVYVLQYRMEGRLQPRRLAIGVHGSPWTPDEARKRALELKAEIAKGVDPLSVRDSKKKAVSIKQLCEIYKKEAFIKKKENTIISDRGQIDRHIIPLLGNKMAQDVTVSDIEKLVRDVAAGKTAAQIKTKPRGLAVIKGGKSVANRTLAVLSAIYSFGISNGYCVINPALGIRGFKENRRERFLNSAELAHLGEVLREVEQSKDENSYSIAALRLLIFTGCRKMEILTLKWEYVDFERQLLLLPDSKTGARAVYLSAPALQVLSSLKRKEKNPYVICGDKDGQYLVGLPKVWRRIKKRAGLDNVRLHDLRHSFASMAAASGNSLLMIGKLLGHKNSSTTARYAHLAVDPVKQAMEGVAGKLSGLIGEQSGAVVRIYG